MNTIPRFHDKEIRLLPAGSRPPAIIKRTAADLARIEAAAAKRRRKAAKRNGTA